MRFLRQSLTGLLLMSLTLGLLVVAGQTIVSAYETRAAAESASQPRRERVFPVNTLTARYRSETPVMTAYGEIVSRRTLEIRARTSGTLIEVSSVLENGGAVREGQFLARIDPADAQFALDRANADLTDAQSEVREAERGLVLARDELSAARQQANLRKKALARQIDLASRGVGTAATVEMAEVDAFQAEQSVLTRRQAEANAEARTDQAQTRLARARIALAEAQKRFDDTTIVAGFSGILTDVSVVEGRFVTANEQIATLVDDTALDVAFRISTTQYTRLLDDKGALLQTPVRVSLSVFGTQIEAQGNVTRNSASVASGETGRKIYARLDPVQGMKPGDFVTVYVNEPPLDQVVRLPASALGPEGAVLVLAEDNRLSSLPVTLLRRQGDDILVRADTLDGQSVVAERTPLLGPGIKVRPLQSPSIAEPALADLMELSEDRRVRLRNYVENSADISEPEKQKLLRQLDQPRVPTRTVELLEQRMGG